MQKVHAFGDDCLGDLDATGVAEAIAAGEFSAAEALDAALARIDSVNPLLNAVAIDDRDRAHRRAVENRFPAGYFAGVPTVIKNNTDFAGLPTRHGSAAVPARAATANEPFTDQFLSSGVNVLGASTLPPFGLTATTEFVDREPTRNPWDTDHSCGASSGGSAVLVASGAVPVAHANDGGGSIRIPAAACGLVGLKPSRDRVVTAAEAEAAPIDIVANGVVSRSVRDSARFLHDAERFRRAPRLPEVGLVERAAARRLRIGLITDTITGRPIDDATADAVEHAATLLGSLGHHVETMPLPVDPSFVDQFANYWSLLAFSLEYFGKRLIDKDFDRSAIDPFTHGLSRMFLRGFWRAPSSILGLRRATARFRAVFDHVDVVMSPTLGHTTPLIGHLDPAGDFDVIFDRLLHYVAFTPANNTNGTPAISLPMAQSLGGLPIGVQFAADLGRERTLLELAYEIEDAAPFARIQD